MKLLKKLRMTVYILKNPYKEIDGYDGVPEGNPHLLKITTENFKKELGSLKKKLRN